MVSEMQLIQSVFSSGSAEYSGKNFIRNTFVESLGKRVYPRYSPFDNAQTGVFADSTIQDVEDAIDAANIAFISWCKISYDLRAKLLENLSDLVSKHKWEISEAITREMGKPISESMMEVEYSAYILNWFAGETKRMHGEIFNHPFKNKMYITYKPHGVVALISPVYYCINKWNFPFAMPVRSLGSLLGAGCTCVFKPCTETPLIALLLANLVKRAGFPSGIFNVITADYESTPPIGFVLSTHPLVRHVCFTGSIEVGKLLMVQSASTVKRFTMELGGNAPAIVFKTANIEKAVRYGGFENQACVSPNRIFVQTEVYDEFLKILVDGVSKLKCGFPFDESTQIAGLYGKRGFDKVSSIVQTAIREGAQCIYQGPMVEECGPFFYPPTILTGCRFEMSIFKCEIFGPVCPIFRFDTESEVFEQMNKCVQGLAAYVYSTDMSQVFRTIDDLNFGLVAVNDWSPSKHFLTFGGHKESGVGTAMGLRSLHNYSDAQSVVINFE